MRKVPSDSRMDTVYEYIDNQPEPKEAPGWSGPYGENPDAAGRAWQSGGGILTRTWVNLDLGYEIGYMVEGQGDELGEKPVRVVVQRLVGDGGYESRRFEKVTAVEAPNDEAALERVDELISQVEAGQFD